MSASTIALNCLDRANIEMDKLDPNKSATDYHNVLEGLVMVVVVVVFLKLVVMVKNNLWLGLTLSPFFPSLSSSLSFFLSFFP